MSLPINSEWRVEAESASTRTIVVTKSETHTFTAEYVEPAPHGGIFTGEVRTRTGEKTVLSLRLRGEETDYTAFFVGTREGDEDKYVGSWHDVAHGFSGKFRLIRTK
jgi:hypothetical protein